MTQEFEIIDVPLSAPVETENLGTKEKFWFSHDKFGTCLFKKARLDTGEDWSEKIAAELSSLLQLPHAIYELASFDGKWGIISPSFIPDKGSLSLGNEILSQLFSDYPINQSSPSQHTVEQVFSALDALNIDLPNDTVIPDNIDCSAELFLGYLLLDAWIGNTDRHHENWGIISLDARKYLAPTYDHASCLGRNLCDRERQARLTTKDQGYTVQSFVEKGLSCLYQKTTDQKPLKLREAFLFGARVFPKAAQTWLSILETITPQTTLSEILHHSH